MSEPLYNLETREWTHTCPCIRAEQVDPECVWHGRGLHSIYCGNTIAPVNNGGRWGSCARVTGHEPPCTTKGNNE